MTTSSDNLPMVTRYSRWHRVQHRWAPYLFVSPFLLMFVAVSLWPILNSLVLSLYITNGPRDSVFVGAANYHYLWHDPDFHVAVRNTVVFAVWSLLLQVPLALLLAVLLSQRWVRGRELLRLAFFSPYLMGGVFTGVLFQIIFSPQGGLLNRFLNAASGGCIPTDIKWLGTAAYVMPALVLTALWLYVGLHMIYFLAALQGVDRDLYEAAQVDGANAWHQFRAVTLPGIRPVAVFVVITSTIGSFQLFEMPYILLNNTPGPNRSGLTVVMYMYNRGFVTGDLGYASAVGWTLALGVLVISLIQARVSGAWRGSNP